MPARCSQRQILLDRLRAFAATRFGFATIVEAEALGISRRTLRSWCDSGLIRRIARGLFHVSCRWDELTPDQKTVARLLAAGPDAALARIGAMAFAGGTRFTTSVTDIIVPTDVSAVLPGTRIHRVEDLRVEDVRLFQGFRVTSDEWTVAELGRDFTDPVGRYQIANAIHAINYRERTTDLADRVEAELDRRRHVGAPIVRRAIDLHRATSAGTRTRTEDRYVDMALKAWPVEPLVNCVTTAGGVSYEVDIRYLDEMVRIELDGGQHGRIHDAAKDTVSDQRFGADGLLTLRESWRSVWRDLPGCRRRLLIALRSRSSNASCGI
jgi:hypothetical protein